MPKQRRVDEDKACNTVSNVVELQKRIHELEKKLHQATVGMKSVRYGLNWVDCPEAFDADCENKIPVLTEVLEKAIAQNDGKPTHILIEGDNYHALQCLNFTHRGRIDVIYIDPPYNTGSDGFTYKDKRFLEQYPNGEVIGKDHPLRHSAWLSFMEKRLKLAKTLLKNDGVIFISIDDNEMANLKLLCDRVFLEKNFIGNIDWESKTKSQNTKSAFDKLQPKVEHVLVYTKNGRNHFNLYTVGKRMYDKKDACGVYREYKIEVMASDGVRGRETMVFPIASINPPSGQQWKLGSETIKEYKERGDLFVRDNWPYVKIRPEDERAEVTEPFWGFIPKSIGTAETAKKELSAIIGKHTFETVKPVSLIKKLVFHAATKKGIVLDFFAGSGTSLEAIQKLNAEDGGCRTCIICTDNENGICEKITYKRVSNVLKGYKAEKKTADLLMRRRIEMPDLRDSKDVLDEIKKCQDDKRAEYASFNVEIEEGCVIVEGERKSGIDVPPLGGSLKYYRTAFVGKHGCAGALDEDRSELAEKAGCLLSLAEDTLQTEKVAAKDCRYWQHYSDGAHRHTLIYYSDDLAGFEALSKKADALRAADKAARLAVYVFTIGSVDAFENEFDDMRHITIKPIPEPILEIYKTINEG